MKCPRCQMENAGDSTYCSRCGSRLGGGNQDAESGFTRPYVVPVRMDLEVGTTFAGRYQVLEELGGGGMGKVYKVLDKEINEKIAIKILKPEISLDEKIIERFRNELKLARKISHPNICRVYDLIKERGMYFITMEYISGEDLKSTVSRVGQLSVGKTLAIARQVCKGLAEAHKMGVIHRDLKPHNIIIDRDGDVRVMDFGIAHSMKTQGITESGVMIGTPEYMSPEQAVGEEADQRSDIYSLGIIIFELLTGIVPFKAETAVGVAIKQKMETPPSPRAFNPQISDEVNRLILRCLEKEPEKRFQKIEDVLDEISRILRGRPSTEKILPTKPATVTEIGKKRPSRARAAALAALLVIGVGAAGYLAYSKFFARPALPPGHGALRIDSAPQGADVYLNDELKGRTPLKNTPFPQGDYRVRVALSGYKEIQERLQVIEGQALSKKYPLEGIAPAASELSAIDIGSIPAGAAVYLDDEFKGNTPTGAIKVPPGAHRLKVALADHREVSEDIQVEKDATWAKEYALEKAAAGAEGDYTVLITSEPAGASIFIDGTYLSKTPSPVSLAKSSGVLEVQKANYATEKVVLTLKPGTNPERHFDLKPVSVRVSVFTEPSEAKVTLGNIDLGLSPVERKSVKPGRYNLKIEKAGYKTYSALTTISKDVSLKIPLPQLAKVMVHFISNAPAEAYLDGVLFKKENETSRSEYIYEGEHVVEFRTSAKPVKQFSATVVLEPGKTYRVHGNVLTEKINCIDITNEAIKKIDD